MLTATIYVSITVSVPDETLAGALARDMREAVTEATTAYFSSEGAKVTIATNNEHDYTRTQREKWQSEASDKT
jgi:hypothetical protein